MPAQRTDVDAVVHVPQADDAVGSAGEQGFAVLAEDRAEEAVGHVGQLAGPRRDDAVRTAGERGGAGLGRAIEFDAVRPAARQRLAVGAEGDAVTRPAAGILLL